MPGWRRRWTQTCLVALLAGGPVTWQGVAVAQPAQAVQPAAPALKAEQLSPSVWYVRGQSALASSANQNFISNAGFVVTPQGVVVIDALGSPVLAERLLAEIRRVTPLPVTHVIVTHYHADHIYGLQTFQAQGAQIWAQRAARQYLASDAAQDRLAYARRELAPWVNAQTRLVTPDHWVDGPTELNLGGMRLVLHPTGPSHTPEDLVVYLPGDKVLFTGDLVFNNRVPFVGEADSARWLAALDLLLTFEVRLLVPGHGTASTEPEPALRLTRDYLQTLRGSMGRAARAMEPFEAAYQATDWRRFEQLPLFDEVNRANAYNSYLRLEHEAAK